MAILVLNSRKKWLSLQLLVSPVLREDAQISAAERRLGGTA